MKSIMDTRLFAVVALCIGLPCLAQPPNALGQFLAEHVLKVTQNK